MNKKQTVSIKTTEENPESMELIASSIIKISDAFEKLKSTRLDQRVIVLLIKDRCKNISYVDIEQILNIIPRLKDIYIKKLKT